MLKQPQEKIFDQYTDKSGAALIKIAGRLQDKKLAKLAIDTLFSMDRPQASDTSFPSVTPRDTFLSRIYFEGQRDKIEKTAALNIEKRLEVAEVLHDIPNKTRFKKIAQVTEPKATIALLPMCKIASKAELVQAGKDFCKDFEKLSSADRRIFSRNFVKTAKLTGIKIPDTIKIYACEQVEARKDLADQVLLRKAAMEGSRGEDGGFGALYDSLRQIDTNALKMPDLYKIARLLDSADNFYGIREKGPGKTIPDAWQSVFQIKKADIETPAVNVESMTKADIISRYGEGALEEVEDDEGEIDREKLRNLIQAVGWDKNDSTNNDNANNDNANNYSTSAN